MAKKYDQAQVEELLYQALETEQGGIQVYTTAITCAINDDLRKEWEGYLDETRTHEKVLLNVDPAAAQLVAAECVVLAETKDHQNWELIGHVAEKSSGPATKILKQAHEAVEKDEDHHLYHTKGWTRELWIESLGLPAVLPPPEEVKKVETAIGASRAEQARDEMLKKH
jgi:hypothetical protein